MEPDFRPDDSSEYWAGGTCQGLQARSSYAAYQSFPQANASKFEFRLFLITKPY
jgi:hypothetical protein